MASPDKTEPKVVDDYSGETIPASLATRVSVSFGGRAWELTLGPKSLRVFEARIDPFLGSLTPKLRRTRTVNNKSVRQWASANGYDVAPRGRIPELVIRQYLAAQGLSAYTD